MTVLLSGCTCKYEIEAIVKLFFPAELFDFRLEETDALGDVCVLRKKLCRHSAYYFAYVRIGSRSRRMALKADKGLADGFTEKFTVRTLCRLLFLCLRELTGISPAWGTLTGIRPVKRINRLLDTGKSIEAIADELEKTFLVTREKTQLAYRTAVTQRPLLTIPARSFSLYVSIPFCPTRCSYCSFVSQSVESAKKRIPEYIERLIEEIKITAALADRLSLSLDTVYFGGGTPTSLEAGELERIMQAVSREFNLSSLREYNVEAGRADTITAEKLAVIKENGATRISINPQTMNDAVLRAVGRNHTAMQVRKAFQTARRLGFLNINMDLIAGLPEDTPEGFARTLDEVLAMKPESITVHTLSLKRSSSLFTQSQDVLKNPAPEMVSLAGRLLPENGWNPYYLYRQKNTLGNLENVGYARAGFESLYNIFIMEEIQTILAVGAAGSTKLVRPETKDIRRIFNYKFPYEYIGRFDELMQKKQEVIDFYKE